MGIGSERLMQVGALLLAFDRSSMSSAVERLETVLNSAVPTNIRSAHEEVSGEL